MSKYFGESERLLGKVFTLANEIPNGAIIFLDEVLVQRNLNAFDPSFWSLVKEYIYMSCV